MRTQPIPTLAAAGLLATLALPCAALAGSPLAANAIPVDPNRSVSGHFNAAGTQTWRLYLRQGRYYAVWGRSGDHVAVTVRAAGGGALGRFTTPDDEGAHGASFRAPYTGLYSVAVACQADYETDCTRVAYSLFAGRDCPGDRSTACGIAVGQTLHGLQARFVEDDDWFGTRLQAGVTYTAQAGDEQPDDLPLCVAVRDGRGFLVASGTCGAPGVVTFAPRAAGLYYVEVKPSYAAAPSTYSLSLGR